MQLIVRPRTAACSRNLALTIAGTSTVQQRRADGLEAENVTLLQRLEGMQSLVSHARTHAQQLTLACTRGL